MFLDKFLGTLRCPLNPLCYPCPEFRGNNIDCRFPDKSTGIVGTQQTGSGLVYIDKDPVLVDGNPVERGFNKASVFFLAFKKRFLCPLAFGDILVCSQHADDLPLFVEQGNLGGPEPRLAAVRFYLGFFVINPGLAGLHHLAIIGPVEIRSCF